MWAVLPLKWNLAVFIAEELPTETSVVNKDGRRGLYPKPSKAWPRAMKTLPVNCSSAGQPRKTKVPGRFLASISALMPSSPAQPHWPQPSGSGRSHDRSSGPLPALCGRPLLAQARKCVVLGQQGDHRGTGAIGGFESGGNPTHGFFDGKACLFQGFDAGLAGDVFPVSGLGVSP